MDPSASAILNELGPLSGHGLSLTAFGALLGTVAGAIWMVGGLRTVDRHNCMEHPQRRKLLEWITSEPGVHLRELAMRLGTAVTNTQWHLRKLERAGIVRTEKAHGRRLYYPTQGGQAAKERAIRNAASRNANADRLLQYIAAHPGVHAALLSDALGMNPGTVRWHLRRMHGAKLLRSIPEGALVHYFAAEAQPVHAHHAHPPAHPASEPRSRAP